MPIALRGCSFSYGWGPRRRWVLRDFDLRFPAGCTVLLGPNGAGKTTLLSLAASLLWPQRGKVTLERLTTAHRHDLRTYRRKVGLLPQFIQAVPGLRVREQVAYAGWLKGQNRRDAWDSASDALARVQMSDLAQRPASKLSGGQLRRMGIAQALVHDAEVLLLDEPTAGLDPTQRGRVRRLIGELSETTAVVVSTHQTDDISRTYDSVIVLDDGQVRFHGGVQELTALVPEVQQRSAAEHVEAAYVQLIGEES